MGLFDWLTNREKDDFMDGYREGQRDAMFGAEISHKEIRTI